MDFWKKGKKKGFQLFLDLRAGGKGRGTPTKPNKIEKPRSTLEQSKCQPVKNPSELEDAHHVRNYRLVYIL
jgi:hypothetical protein